MDPFVGEIRIMPYGGNSAYNYIPQGWAPCQGQLLPINQNQALFALLSTQYGGDGRTTFAVPDLRGRAIVGQGQGPGLSSYPQGTATGTESVTLNANQVPAHIHSLQGGTSSVAVSSSPGNQNGAANGYFAANPSQEQYGQAASGNTKQMLSGTTAAAGGNQAHEDRMPFLAFNYFIALTGVFPQRQ